MAVSHRGAISFGMVHIPVGLYTATQDNDIHFNQLCKEDGSRVKYRKVCAGCGKEIGSGDIVKGCILIEILFFAEEVKEAPREVGHPDIQEAELPMAKTLVNAMVQPFQPEQYKYEYKAKLWDIINQKMTSIVLGQYRDGQLIYKGHVPMGVGGESFRKIRELSRLHQPPMKIPEGNENAVWVQPLLVCTVKYMMKTESGGLRQPVFKGLRDDKRPEECMED